MTQLRLAWERLVGFSNNYFSFRVFIFEETLNIVCIQESGKRFSQKKICEKMNEKIMKISKIKTCLLNYFKRMLKRRKFSS